MNRLTRAILMALPINRESSAERAYRSELRAFRDRGWVLQLENQWVRTPAGSAVVGLPPAPSAHESGTMLAVRPPEAAAPPPPPPVPVVGIFARAPEPMAAELDLLAAEEGSSRNAVMLRLLEEALEARSAAAHERPEQPQQARQASRHGAHGGPHKRYG